MNIWDFVFIGISFIFIAILAFYMGRKLAPQRITESKTTTFLIKSIQAIAELAVLEYITEGVAEIKEKTMSLITKELLAAKDYAGITKKVKETIELIKQIRKNKS